MDTPIEVKPSLPPPLPLLDSKQPPESPPRTIMQMVTPGIRARRNKRLLLYFHIPFCSSKCHFCDWVVGYETSDLVNRGELRERYVDAMVQQVRTYAPRLAELRYRVTNIYWGGGTPTRLEASQIARIHDAVAESMDLSQLTEYTAEGSPETVSAAHLETWMKRGLNRQSIGVQSFDNQVLKRMGRAHDAGKAEQALELFRQAGLQNYNIDLIAGFPDQSRDSLLDSLWRTIDLGVPHVSLYMFREFASNLVSVVQAAAGHRRQTSAEVRAEAYFAASQMLRDAGYNEYLVGYFAREDRFQFDAEEYYFGMHGDYFGFGAGATSTIGRFSLKSRDSSRYGSSHVRAFVEDPDKMVAAPCQYIPDDVYITSYFKAFVTREGLRFDRWNDQFGFDFQTFRKNRPGIRKWFADREAEGARFIEDARGIRLTPETWAPSMVWRR
ncbi:MAG TPA: coproporphyrinogen-III oxidase family protein [Bryobacteraceae bacterium]|jgi:oxygen-independent coproporphyrinogen-3 oxidase